MIAELEALLIEFGNLGAFVVIVVLFLRHLNGRDGVFLNHLKQREEMIKLVHENCEKHITLITDRYSDSIQNFDDRLQKVKEEILKLHNKKQ